LQRARIAVVAYFVVLGVANGVWLARIPAVKQGLHLSDGALGLALLAAPAGLVVAAPIASRIAHRAGSRRLTLVAGLLVILGLLALGLASSRAALMAALFGFGLSSGLLDVGMNSQAVLVERAAGRPLMTSFHACFSIGGLAGALLGGAFAWAGVGLLVNFTTASIPLACGAALAGRWLLPDQDGNGADPASVPPPADRARADPDRADRTEPDRTEPDLAKPAPAAPELAKPAPAARSFLVPPLLLMALLATCALLGEGAADGWSAVYLRDDLGAPAGLAALAYAGFCVAMAAGRLTGDRLAARFGPVTVLRCSGLTAAVGLTCALVAGHAAGAIAGFAIFGAGLSCTFPLLLSAAGRADPARPARGIATVAGLGYVGMLAGPVLIGGLAGAFSLTTALTIPILLALAICAGAGLARPRREPAVRPPGLAGGLGGLQGGDGAHEQVQAEFEVGVVIAAAQLRPQIRHLRELGGPQTCTTHVAVVGRVRRDPGLGQQRAQDVGDERVHNAHRLSAAEPGGADRGQRFLRWPHDDGRRWRPADHDHRAARLGPRNIAERPRLRPNLLLPVRSRHGRDGDAGHHRIGHTVQQC
jgi:MFS family permease